jgi:hypothetical protein
MLLCLRLLVPLLERNGTFYVLLIALGTVCMIASIHEVILSSINDSARMSPNFIFFNHLKA